MKIYLYLVSLLILFLAGCERPQDPTIDLNRLYSLATPESQEIIPLRMAVAAVISPKGTLESYQSLQEYLSERLQRPVELVQRANYMEINDLIEAGDVDVAFVCTGAYIQGVKDFGMEILAAPEINGDTVYHSWLIVPSNSPYQSIVDLEGKTFAFTDPLSYTGRIYPTYLVQQLGKQPEDYFEKIFYTYSHDAAIHAVADGLADGAAIDNLIYLYLLEREPEIQEKVRIIHRSYPFGIPPIVTSPAIRPQLKAEVIEILLNMHQDDEGLEALRILGIDRFVLIDEEAYTSVFELEANVNLTGID
jgi:phosphonate transport system substrate-binding protein